MSHRPPSWEHPSARRRSGWSAAPAWPASAPQLAHGQPHAPSHRPRRGRAPQAESNSGPTPRSRAIASASHRERGTPKRGAPAEDDGLAEDHRNLPERDGRLPLRSAIGARCNAHEPGGNGGGHWTAPRPRRPPARRALSAKPRPHGMGDVGGGGQRPQRPSHGPVLQQQLGAGGCSGNGASIARSSGGGRSRGAQPASPGGVAPPVRAGRQAPRPAPRRPNSASGARRCAAKLIPVVVRVESAGVPLRCQR